MASVLLDTIRIVYIMRGGGGGWASVSRNGFDIHNILLRTKLLVIEGPGHRLVPIHAG